MAITCLQGAQRPLLDYVAVNYNVSNCIFLYHTILYYTILYYTILYYTILYYTILYYTILYYTILYYTILVLYCTALYCTIPYHAIPYYTLLYYTILYYTILYYTILYYTILYYTIPYCTILNCVSRRNTGLGRCWTGAWAQQRPSKANKALDFGSPFFSFRLSIPFPPNADICHTMQAGESHPRKSSQTRLLSIRRDGGADSPLDEPQSFWQPSIGGPSFRPRDTASRCRGAARSCPCW